MSGTERTLSDYRRFLESTPLIPWEADARTWRFTYVGPQAADFLGYPVEDWYRDGFWTGRIHPDDRDQAVETCERLSAVGGSYDFEYRMVKADGDILWVRDMVSVGLGDDGPVLLYGYLIDVTEQKSLEIALSAAEARLEELLRAAPEAMILVEADGTIAYLNDEARALFGYERDELTGSSIDVLVPEGRRLQHREHRAGFALDPHRRGMGRGLEVLGVHRDGSEIPVEILLGPISSAEGGDVLCSVRDLRERKRFEGKLLESERQLRRMVNGLPSMVAFVDTQQRYRWVNDLYANWFGVERDAVENRQIREVIGEKLYEKVRPSIEAALRGEPVHSRTEFPRSEGGVSPIDLTLLPQIEDTGTIYGYIVIAHDISDEVAAQEADHRHRAELAHVSRVATMGELATSIAHELNQPLSAIIANAQAARRLLESDPPDLMETIDALADIVSDGVRAGAVISHMRGFLESGEHAQESVRLGELSMEVCEMLRSEAIRSQASLTVDAETDLPSIMGDPVQLKQVLLNLVFNALEAVARVDGEARTVIVATSCSDGEIEVTVSDSGAGLSDGRLQNLFTPFASTKPGGLGVGLSISHTIVEAHGGLLLATNIPGGGARFVVRMPVPEVDRTVPRSPVT